MNCPHCNCEVNIPQVAFVNAESYGSNTFVFRCNKCKGKYAVLLRREVRVVDIFEASPTAPTSFGD